MATRCPCYSGQPYATCCQPLHLGAAAPDAERLMRARYSAYVHHLPDYILQTWHADTRPKSLTHHDLQGLKWLKLAVLSASAAVDDHAYVSFAATYQARGQKKAVLQERSHFVRQAGRWWYVDGEVPAATEMPE